VPNTYTITLNKSLNRQMYNRHMFRNYNLAFYFEFVALELWLIQHKIDITESSFVYMYIIFSILLPVHSNSSLHKCNLTVILRYGGRLYTLLKFLIPQRYVCHLKVLKKLKA